MSKKRITIYLQDKLKSMVDALQKGESVSGFINGLVADRDPDLILMPRGLTAENGAKGLLMGEFKIDVDMVCTSCYNDAPDFDCETCGGDVNFTQKVTIDWTTIKEIYDMAAKGLGQMPSASSCSDMSTVTIERASPVQMRKCLKLVDQMKHAGIAFMPIPIIEDVDVLYNELVRKMDVIEKSCQA